MSHKPFFLALMFVFLPLMVGCQLSPSKQYAVLVRSHQTVSELAELAVKEQVFKNRAEAVMVVEGLEYTDELLDDMEPFAKENKPLPSAALEMVETTLERIRKFIKERQTQ